MRNYYTYILTNKKKTVLYTGMTNNISRRLREHKEGIYKNSFTARYNCHFLVYYEIHFRPIHALDREKQIKGWTRMKKEDLINSFNPEWRFLNDEASDGF